MASQLSRYSEMLRNGHSKIDPQQEDFSPLQKIQPAPGPTQPPIGWLAGVVGT
jgi:hypothetical protein